MIHLIQSWKRSLKVAMAVIAVSLFFCTPIALASNRPDVLINKSLEVENGGFDYQITKPIPGARIGKATVVLPPGESGKIDSIAIIGPDKKLEFACRNLPVMNGTDLITSCGGPAYLKAGDTTYMASGSGFKPDANTTLVIELDAN